MAVVTVQASKSYDVLISSGLIEEAGKLVRGVCSGGKALIVSDENVFSLYGEALSRSLEKTGFQVFTFVFPSGEASKTLSTYARILDRLCEVNASRQDVTVALGGGVAGDLAGFAAATYMRGIDFVNIPTTALSQVDSCIGGKTALDIGGIKNIVGAFRQPSAVIVDPDVLSTLPERQLNAGLAETVKAGLIRDPELFEIFEGPDFRDRIEEIIYRALKVKKDIVEADEFDAGERKLLNFGHTFGHAYESFFGLERFLHGECVAMGMMKILEDPALKERVRKVLEKLGLPTECEADPERIMELIRSDKKADHGVIDMVLADDPGKAYIRRMSIDELKGKL